MQMDQRGFTIIDLLITLAIAGTLLGAGLPSFQDFIAKHRTTFAINKMVGVIHFARMNSITRGNTVTICPRLDSLDCGKDWSQGTIVFTDNDSNGKLENDEEILRIFERFNNSGKGKWVSFGSNNYLRYRADGSTIGQNGSFTYCPTDGNAKYAHQIIINRTGRARLAPDSNGDGIRENTQGDNLSCN